MMNMERELILKAKSGNRSAFEELIRIYFPKLYKAAYFFLYNGDDAADICQDTFLKAYNNLGRFDEKRSFYPWLYTILKNLCFNLSRKRGRVKDDELSLDLLEGKYTGPEAELIIKDDSFRLKKAISLLPEMYREILILKTYNDLSYEDIAKSLDIPKGTVMSRLYNARVKLRQILARLEGGTE